MPSSTFNSEPHASNSRGIRASAALLLALLLISLGIETLCRFENPRFSGYERRIQREFDDLLHFSDRSSYAVRTVVLGNSLLRAGVQFEEAKQRLSPAIDAKRFLVEDTNYFDWKYGMRRLFSRGIDADVIVLVMTPRQLVSTRIHGGDFAYHLMNLSDVLAVAGDVGASNTQISDLAFSNLSAFGGTRAEIRKRVARTLLPDLPRLTGLMTAQEPAPLDAGYVRSESQRRLKALKELAEQYHARVVLVLPPEAEKAGSSLASAVQEAGASAGVRVLVPVPPGSMPASMFSDGFHLNERGAKLFTPRFVEALQTEISPHG
jgi:hypothetical protein